MKLIEKLLMENKVNINELGRIYIKDGVYKNVLHISISIEADEPMGIKSKEQLLAEVPAAIFVSAFEWEMMNHWKECNGKTLIKTYSYYDDHLDINAADGNGNRVGPTLCIDDDRLFSFLKLDEQQDLQDIINRAVLIEG